MSIIRRDALLESVYKTGFGAHLSPLAVVANEFQTASTDQQSNTCLSRRSDRRSSHYWTQWQDLPNAWKCRQMSLCSMFMCESKTVFGLTLFWYQRLWSASQMALVIIMNEAIDRAMSCIGWGKVRWKERSSS